MSYKVLIVEDEGLIAHDIASRLQALGHTVVFTASTAEEAIEHASEAEVVLMDIRLDGEKDGVEAAREIRARYRLPVIFLTAHADRHTLERAKLAEPFGYIVKPIGHASLQTTIEIVMHKHKLERDLEERESWLRTTLSSVAEAVIVTDAQGKVILANGAARALFGAGEDRTLNKMNVDKLNIADSLDVNLAAFLPGDPIRLAILRDEPVRIDTHIREQAVEGSAAPVRASGCIIGTVLTLRNVTFQRWQEQQVRQAQKMEAAARLAAGVSSEYATLLAIVRKETQRLLGRFTGQSVVRQSLEEIQHATLQAEELTRRLSGLGTRQVGRPEPLSLNALIRRMQKSIESVVSEELAVSARLEPSLDKIHADPGQMEQMILNLATVMGSEDSMRSGRLDSALRANAGSLAAPRLVIQTSSAGEYVRLQLFVQSAEGGEGGEQGAEREHGMDRAQGERSGARRKSDGYKGSPTQPIYRESGASPMGPLPSIHDGQRQEPSVPLELSLAHAIATEYDGLLTAEGEGFQVLLPVWRESAPALAPAEAPHTLLLIEAREKVRTQLHNFFETAGFNLLEANDRDEALALLEIHGVRAAASVSEAEGVRAKDLSVENPPGEALSTDKANHVASREIAASNPENDLAIDLVLGSQEATQGIEGVEVILLDQPKVQVMTQSDLLEYVRAHLNPKFTFSASA